MKRFIFTTISTVLIISFYTVIYYIYTPDLVSVNWFAFWFYVIPSFTGLVLMYNINTFVPNEFYDDFESTFFNWLPGMNWWFCGILLVFLFYYIIKTLVNQFMYNYKFK